MFRLAYGLLGCALLLGFGVLGAASRGDGASGDPSARRYELSEMSCAQFMRLDAEERREVAAFVNGYYLGASRGASPVYDAEYVGDVVEILLPCARVPQASFWNEIVEFFPS